MNAAFSLGFAEAAVARVCHDLSGPIGTMLNALDMMSEGGEVAAEARQIAHDVAEELSLRMRLAKLLWGQAVAVHSREVPGLVLPPSARGRAAVRTEELADVPMQAEQARLLACVVAFAAECLRGSGEILLAGDATREVLVRIAGPRARWGAELPELLARPERAAEGADAREMMVRLLVLLAAAQGAKLGFLLAPGAAAGPPPLLLTFRGG